MIAFCFTQLEHYLKQIKNVDEDYVFQQSRRLVREKPDFDFIAANVTENNPYALITIADYKEISFNSFYDTYAEYYVTAIVHAGTGTAAYEITGSHEGNNSYVLKISQGGIVGTPPLPQYQLKINDGVYSAPADIPADGKIEIGDATTFEFSVGGEVVTNDTYTWQTIARRVNVKKDKEINLHLRAAIWAKTKKELFETGGYFSQLSQLLIEPYVTDGIQVIRQSPGPSRWIQSDFEKEHNLVAGAIEIDYAGSLFHTTYDALACRLVLSVDND